ncbi:MAG: hypothetical protein L6R37_007607 [Teloschistes peruensis]|nr:MAG: hypothetical protein L6R37_007607 [Teloschistes peruensis]
MRYVARNGRSTGSPWSLRQTAVYQQYNASTKNTAWVFLQPSADMQRRWQEIQRSKVSSSSPATPHVVLLFAIAADWKDYIAYLRQEVDNLDKKACYSRVGRRHEHDYIVTFDDSQRVQNLRERLLRILNVLDAQLEVAEGCVVYCRGFNDRISNFDEAEALLELGAHTAQLRTHRRAVAAILDRSQGTLELLFKILEYRNEENLSRSGVALHKDIETLRDIAFHSKRENETLVKLAEQSKKDGRALKALAVLGTLYLPPTFIAVCAFPSVLMLR